MDANSITQRKKFLDFVSGSKTLLGGKVELLPDATVSDNTIELTWLNSALKPEPNYLTFTASGSGLPEVEQNVLNKAHAAFPDGFMFDRARITFDDEQRAARVLEGLKTLTAAAMVRTGKLAGVGENDFPLEEIVRYTLDDMTDALEGSRFHRNFATREYRDNLTPLPTALAGKTFRESDGEKKYNDYGETHKIGREWVTAESGVTLTREQAIHLTVALANRADAFAQRKWSAKTPLNLTVLDDIAPHNPEASLAAG